jgi:hypothetical protein
MKTALIAAGLLLLASGAALAQRADVPAADDAAQAHFTLDTPIRVLIADPAAKAVLDKDLPGLSTDENLAKFEDKSLRQFQPLTGGQLTDALLAKTGKDLAAIDGSVAVSVGAAAGVEPAGNPDAPKGR